MGNDTDNFNWNWNRKSNGRTNNTTELTIRYKAEHAHVVEHYIRLMSSAIALLNITQNSSNTHKDQNKIRPLMETLVPHPQQPAHNRSYRKTDRHQSPPRLIKTTSPRTENHDTTNTTRTIKPLMENLIPRPQSHTPSDEPLSAKSTPKPKHNDKKMKPSMIVKLEPTLHHRKSAKYHAPYIVYKKHHVYCANEEQRQQIEHHNLLITNSFTERQMRTAVTNKARYMDSVTESSTAESEIEEEVQHNMRKITVRRKRMQDALNKPDRGNMRTSVIINPQTLNINDNTNQTRNTIVSTGQQQQNSNVTTITSINKPAARFNTQNNMNSVFQTPTYGSSYSHMTHPQQLTPLNNNQITPFTAASTPTYAEALRHLVQHDTSQHTHPDTDTRPKSRFPYNLFR